MNTISIDAENQRALAGAALGPREHIRKGYTPPRRTRRDFGSRKILSGVLVLAGALGLGYSVSFLVTLVQSCAVFAAGVGRLIQ